MQKRKFPQNLPPCLADYFSGYKRALLEATETLSESHLELAGNILLAALKNGATIFSCGNGGSAAIANHLQCDFLKGIATDTDWQPQVRSLSAEISTFSAIANDLSYEQVFSYQLQRLMRPGDVLMAVSSSGSSPNILRALKTVKSLGGSSILLCGFDGGLGKTLADVCLHFEVYNYGIVEDLHQMTMHSIAQYLRLNGINNISFDSIRI